MEHGGRRSRQEWGMAGRRDLGHLAQQLHILRTVIEVEVAHQAPEGFSPQGPILLFVQLLENRALVPSSALVAL